MLSKNQSLQQMYFNTIFMKGAKGEIPSDCSMSIVEYIIHYALDSIEDWVYNLDMHHRCKEFTYTRLPSENDNNSNPDAIKLCVFVEDIDEAPRLDAFCQGRRIEIHLPQKTVDKLPKSNRIQSYSKGEKDVFEWLLCYFLHEILHALGAKHAKQGIMSGTIKLFNDNDYLVPLDDILDMVSLRIVSETLSSDRKFTRPIYTISFDSHKNSLTLDSDVTILTVVIVNKTCYTDKFYFTYNNSFNITIPKDLEWDTVLVHFVHGNVEELSKSDLIARCSYPSTGAPNNSEAPVQMVSDAEQAFANLSLDSV